MSGAYRSIGINRNDFMSLVQMRPEGGTAYGTLEWVAYASNAFNTMVPFYADVDETPEYLANTTGEVSTGNFYWTSRMIAAMADASYGKSLFHVEHYQEKQMELKRKANRKVAEMVQKEASATLKKVLYELSNQMKNSYARSDV